MPYLRLTTSKTFSHGPIIWLFSPFGGDSRDATPANLLLTSRFQATALPSKVAHSCEASVRAPYGGPVVIHEGAGDVKGRLAVFGVSRHRCGQGESAIVVLSRIFVPGDGLCKSRTNRPSCRGGCLDAQVALRGDVHCQPAELGRCSQGWPEGPNAASRAAASLPARNSPATRELASDRGSRSNGARMVAKR
jgi:hypothetical protein